VIFRLTEFRIARHRGRLRKAGGSGFLIGGQQPEKRDRRLCPGWPRYPFSGAYPVLREVRPRSFVPQMCPDSDIYFVTKSLQPPREQPSRSHICCCKPSRPSRLSDFPNPPRCPLRVKIGRTQPEQMSSGLPQTADMARCGWHVSKVPKVERPGLSANVCFPESGLRIRTTAISTSLINWSA
jgi:hypothetical protein